MARPPKQPSDLDAHARRVDSTIRPPAPRANPSDLELEDDAATTVLPLRWPEPPKDLAERLQGVRTDAVGLSRSIGVAARPRRAWFLRALALAVIVGALIRVMPLRSLRHGPRLAIALRPAPAAASALPAPPPLLTAAPLEVILPSVRPAPTKPPIDVTSLPKAAPSSPPPRALPRRVAKPAARAPVPPPDATEETSLHIDENAYDGPTAAKCRTCGNKNDNPY